MLPFLATSLGLSLQPPRVFECATVMYGQESYKVKLQQQVTPCALPPVVLVPPLGVGIDSSFYNRLLEEWGALGAPATMHAPDLLGTGSASPKPRRFYAPEVWAGQLQAYIAEHVGEPCVLVVQGGLLPCALEIWRASGTNAVAGMTLLSPPPRRFFTPETAVPDSATPRRRAQRIAWAVANSPVGNLFFRRLRGGRPRGKRIRAFSEASLFAGAADDEWVDQCVAGARDARGRFATFSYLAGSIPAGGAWRDDRAALFESLDVPVQLLRGDYGGLANAIARAEEFLQHTPRPCRRTSAVIFGARACVPYERAAPTARLLAEFLELHFGAGSDVAGEDSGAEFIRLPGDSTSCESLTAD